MLGALVFAYGGSYAARRFAGLPPLAVAAGQQLGAAVVLAPLLGESISPITVAGIAVIVIGLRWVLRPDPRPADIRQG